MTNYSVFQDIVNNYFAAQDNDLQGEHSELKSFPIEVYHPKICTMAKDYEKVAGFNMDMQGCSILSAVSAAIGNTREVRLKNTHKDIASLYLVIFADPSSNKTRALKFPLQPLLDLQKDLEIEHRKKRAEYKKEMLAHKQNPQGNLPEEPEPLEELVINDATIEILLKQFKNNERGIMYYVDEFHLTLNYLDKDMGAESILLDLWNGGQKSKHRMQYKLFMPNVFLTLVGATQPVNIRRFAERNRNHTGFSSRFLYCYPPDIKAKSWDGDDYEGDEVDYYAAIIRNIYNSRKVDAEGNIILHSYRFEEQAKKLTFYWQDKNTHLTNKTQNNAFKAYYGKLDSYLLRFCLILQTFTDFCEMNPNNQLIRLETVMNAIHLLEYFRRNFFKMQREISNDLPEALKNMSEAKIDIYKKLNDSFGTLEVKEIGNFNHSSQVANFLNPLIKAGVIKKVAHGNYTKIYQA